MKKVLNVFSFSKIRKSEIPECMNAMLAIVEKHDPEALKIAGMYNLLSELTPLLDRLTVKYDGYPVSKELVAERALRDKLLSAVLSHIAAIEKAGVTSTARESALAVPYLKRYLNGITMESSTVKSGKVNQLFAGLETNEDMNNAFSVLGTTLYMNELKSAQQSINLSESQRRETLSVRSKFNTADAREKISDGISNLLNAIELARVEHPDTDYMPLINELNVLISSKQTLIKSRTTRNRNSAEKTTTVALSPTTTATAI